MYIRELLEPSLINRVLILNYQFNIFTTRSRKVAAKLLRRNAVLVGEMDNI